MYTSVRYISENPIDDRSGGGTGTRDYCGHCKCQTYQGIMPRRRTEQVSVAVTCIQNVLGSNLSRDTSRMRSFLALLSPGVVIAQSVWQRATRGSGFIPGSVFFSSPQRPERLWAPPSLLANWYRGLFPRSKAVGA
jgi:hypothetical protein